VASDRLAEGDPEGARRLRGDHEAVVSAFAPLLTGRFGPMDWIQAVVARAEAALGREAGARRRFEELAAGGFARLPRNLRWLSTIAELGHLCADLGDAGRASELEALLRTAPHHHAILPVAICYGGPLGHALARLVALQGRLDEAGELLDEARAAAAGLGARPGEARILLEHGRLLERRGSRRAARERLEEGERLAKELGISSAG
jgi:hypothetical protein